MSKRAVLLTHMLWIGNMEISVAPLEKYFSFQIILYNIYEQTFALIISIRICENIYLQIFYLPFWITFN